MNVEMNHTWTVVLFALIVLGISACASLQGGKEHCIQKGEFVATISETGELEAVKSRVIMSPFIGWKYGGQVKIIGLLEHGTSVAEGDSIAQFDKSGVLKELREQENNLEMEKANLNKLLAQHKSKLKGLQTELETAEATLELYRVQLARHQFESANKRRIKEFEYERQGIETAKIREKLNLNRTVLENELKIQRIKIFRLENNIKDAERALDLLTVRSPLNGMMQILENRRTDQMVMVGDDLWQGYQFACVPDLSEMQVKATVNEADIGKIGPGKKVEVRLDAFPELPFEGSIVKIGKLSYKKNKNDRSKVFDIVVLLEKSDPVLKPGMTVKCEIFTAELDDAYYVSNDCLLREEGTYYICLKHGNKFEKCEVEIGPRNNRYTVVYGDFIRGQQLLPADEISNVLAQAGV